VATIDGLSHAIAFDYNGLLYVVGYRGGAQHLRRSADAGKSWLPFADEETEHQIAAPADAQRAAFVKMGTQGRALVVGVANFPGIDVYISVDDGQTWTQEEGPV